MDRDTRNAIERATQRARKLLEEDFAAQLEGDFDVHRDGAVAAKAGGHLSARQAFQRERIAAVIEHKRAAGLSPGDSVADYLRDAAFTTLNRFVALKMLEARELVQECITKGEQSAGYREFCGMAPGLALLPDGAGYRLYIESLFDELSTEVKVLFERRDPSSVLWPKRATFEQLLEILNSTEFATVWGEDETIGWVYQFFNSKEERAAMRDVKQGGSQAPRNSRELAVRNQFFTPRYVVQFLTDNTLGRIWYEMRRTSTVLADRCEYLARRAGETFTPRDKKDPRDFRVLDPACGSGHFLLYAFDLLLTIYEEAHGDTESPKSETTGRRLAEDYPTVEALRKAMPGLILAHNLHGVDIDPRCAQIAQLALWMRAQKAYRHFRVDRAERSQIRRTNIVVAEPLVASKSLLQDFDATLGDADLSRVFNDIVEGLSLAGEMGLLLRAETLVVPERKRGETGSLFVPPQERIRDALARFVSGEGFQANTGRRLFTDDTAHGLALLEVAEKRFDVILMNPPFGEATDVSAGKIAGHYQDWNRNILCAFIARAQSLAAPRGLCGAVVDRTVNEKSTYEKFRRRYLLGDDNALQLVADLGWSVLDANVEVAALVLGPRGADQTFLGFDLRDIEDKAPALRDERNAKAMGLGAATRLPNAVIGYFFPTFAIRLFDTLPSLRDAGFDLFEGHTLKSERYFRLSWESPDRGREYWTPLFNGTAYSRFAYPHHDIVALNDASGVNGDGNAVIRNVTKHKKAGICFGKRGEYVDAQMFPDGFISTVEGKACLAPSDKDAWAALALINSTLFQFLINLYTGQHKYSGYVELIPYPGAARLEQAAEEARAIVGAKSKLWEHVELSPNFTGLSGVTPEALRTELGRTISTVKDCETRLNEAILTAYGLQQDSEARAVLQATFSSIPVAADPFCSTDLQDCGARRVQAAIGQAFREDPNSGGKQDPTGAWLPPTDILVEDEGSAADLIKLVELHVGDDVTSILLALNHSDMRAYVRTAAFAYHIAYYSRSGRRAPIYWQLATTSARYSIWLYVHAFNKDTLFRVQKDYAETKLAHEERRLESQTSELRDNATAAQREALAAQEGFVEELRAFLEEVKRVAPLWNPNLDDGVIINFAPLWRLVPQHKPWQKELKSTWDALCGGEYEWAHLAMHLWPERVVPKCAKDRSLAIAHGLEDVFWVEGTDGKWTARKTPTKNVDELVRERTSPAVKSALKNLLDAPTASGNGGGGRGGRRRASGAAQGANA